MRIRICLLGGITKEVVIEQLKEPSLQQLHELRKTIRNLREDSQFHRQTFEHTPSEYKSCALSLSKPD